MCIIYNVHKIEIFFRRPYKNVLNASVIQPVTANHFSTVADRWKLLTQAASMFQHDLFDIHLHS